MEDLVDLNFRRGAEYLKPAIYCLEGKMDLRLFKPGHEAEGGGRCPLCIDGCAFGDFLWGVLQILRIASSWRAESCAPSRATRKICSLTG